MGEADSVVGVKLIPNHPALRRFKFTLNKKAVKGNDCLRLGFGKSKMAGLDR